MKEIKFTKEEQQFWDSFISTMKLVTPDVKFIKEHALDGEIDKKASMFEKIAELIKQNLEENEV